MFTPGIDWRICCVTVSLFFEMSSSVFFSVLLRMLSADDNAAT